MAASGVFLSEFSLFTLSGEVGSVSLARKRLSQCEQDKLLKDTGLQATTPATGSFLVRSITILEQAQQTQSVGEIVWNRVGVRMHDEDAHCYWYSSVCS